MNLQQLFQRKDHRRDGEIDYQVPFAEVTRTGALDMQVCVPETWTDEEVRRFAEQKNPSGTANGWFIRTDSEMLLGKPSRNPCAERAHFVHITLDA